MIRAILFDNDGILVDTESLYYEATRDVMREVGFELTEEHFIEYFLRQAKGAWHLADVAKEDIPALRDERNRRYNARLARGIAPIDGVVDAIARLREHFTLGIVTSCRSDHFETIHASTGLLPHFDFVLTREDYKMSKPDPEPYLLAVERAGAAPDECVVVEDSERGLTAAVQAGIDCYIIPRGFTADGDFAAAHTVCDDIKQFADHVITRCETE
jgi:HAD superfamily hydrolase (TIGR01509 family)